MTELLCIIVYLASLFCDTHMLGFSSSSGIWTRFTYIFAHTGLLHLLLNLISYRTFLTVMRKLGISRLLPVAFASAVIATFGSAQPLPTVGLSGVVYGMLGLTVSRVHGRRMIAALAVTALMNVVVLLFGHSNVLLHLLSFIWSFIITSIYGKIRNTAFRKGQHRKIKA